MRERDDGSRPFVGWVFSVTQAQLDLKLADARAEALKAVTQKIRALPSWVDEDGYERAAFAQEAVLGILESELSAVGSAVGEPTDSTD